jgi:hypothetical protein
MNSKLEIDKFLGEMELPTDGGTPIIQVKRLLFVAVGHVPVSDEFAATDGVFSYTVFDNGCAMIKCKNIVIVNDSTSKDMEEAIARIELWRREAIRTMANGGTQL